MSDIDIVDQIDALVDEQLANFDNRSGYDHSVNQERCRCGRDWHGLAITQRIDSMRSAGDFDPDYTFASDDSPIMCVGSSTPGPWRVEPLDASAWYDPSAVWAAMSPWQTIRDLARQERFEAFVSQRQAAADREVIADGRPYMVDRDFRLARGERVGWDNGDGVVHLGRVERHEPDGRGGWTITFFDGITESVTTAAESIRAGFTGLGAQLDADPDIRTPQQRALPQPSTTPPMWANDVTRSRRPRRNRNQPNRQGIA